MAEKHPKTKEHNYLKTIQKMNAQPGTVVNVDVRHDEWCDIYSGGFCNCDPDITSTSSLLPTQFEKLKALLEEMGVEYKTGTFRGDTTIILQEGTKKVDGVSGFYCLFTFLPSGELKEVFCGE